jgi:hypothetical protein
MDGDQEPLGVEAMHLDEPVVVWCGAIDDDQDEVVVVVELGPLVEVLGVFDRERMKLEHVAEDLKVPLAWLIEVEPEKVAAREQLRDLVTIEANLGAALTVNDVTDRGARAVRCDAGASPPPFAGWVRTIASRRAVHRIDATFDSGTDPRDHQPENANEETAV